MIQREVEVVEVENYEVALVDATISSPEYGLPAYSKQGSVKLYLRIEMKH